jgi:succinate dehydrogenase / fumarate reductase flavoprotein subunit
MVVGPTTHYAKGGVGGDGETQMACVPGVFAGGECAAGLHGANRHGGNSLSDLLVVGKRAGEHAAAFAQEHRQGTVVEAHVASLQRDALAPIDRGGDGENAYVVQKDLQDTMQDLVGIVRNSDDLERALERIGALRARARAVVAPGNREYNPGWHTALDLHNLLAVSEAVTLAAQIRKESRGAHTRTDYPEKDAAFGKVNSVIRRADDGSLQVRHEPLVPLRDELSQVIKEVG